VSLASILPPFPQMRDSFSSSISPELVSPAANLRPICGPNAQALVARPQTNRHAASLKWAFFSPEVTAQFSSIVPNFFSSKWNWRAASLRQVVSALSSDISIVVCWFWPASCWNFFRKRAAPRQSFVRPQTNPQMWTSLGAFSGLFGPRAKSAKMEMISVTGTTNGDAH